MSQQIVAIIGAMEAEVRLLRDALHQCQEYHIAGMTINQGILDGHSVVLMQCGIGKVNAALGTALLIDHFGASVVINTGSAGALNTHLNIGDIVIASTLLQHDVDVTAFGYTVGQMAQMPPYYVSDNYLNTIAQQAATEFPNAQIHRGLIVSGDQFIGELGRRRHIVECFPNALAVDMEAAAIAQVCFRFNIAYTVIRAISDSANHNASINFEEFLDTASRHSANMVRVLLCSLSSNQS